MTNPYVGKVNVIVTGAVGDSNPKRSPELIIKKDDSIEKLANKFGMSKEEFKAWAGITGPIKPGQKYILPTDVVPDKGGLYTVAKNNDMTVAELCKLNGIKDPDKYVCTSGEVFYVKRKEPVNQQNNSMNVSKQDKIQEKPNTRRSGWGCSRVKSDEEIQQELQKKTKTASKTPRQIETLNHQWGTTYTPEELARKIYTLAEEYRGAVGRPDFDALIKEINPKNVVEVLRAIERLPENEDKKSLINIITDETKSSKDVRKDAVIHIYDVLAEVKTPPALARKTFVKELDKQFDKLIGKVDTEYLDTIMNGVMSRRWYKTPFPARPVEIPESSAQNDRKIVIPKAKFSNQTVGSLRDSAISSAKAEAEQKFRAYCAATGIEYKEGMLDCSVLDNIPRPVLDDKDNIVPYVSDLILPKGEPNGKVIILNAGHGGYNPDNGAFDVGAYSFVQESNGKYTPILEFDKMQEYTEHMAGKLAMQGYSVVIVQGSASTLCDSQVITHTIDKLKNGKMSDGKKYAQEDIAFVSFHADSSSAAVDYNDKSSVLYNPKGTTSSAFAKTINKNLNSYSNTFVQSELGKRTPGVNGVWVLTEAAPKVPSVLVETLRINGKYGADNMNSTSSREMILDSVLVGINEHFGFSSKNPKVNKPAKEESSTVSQNPKRASYITEEGGGSHTVESGQTLDSISKKYGVSVERIAQASGIDKNSILSIGQVLKIPPKRVLKGVSTLSDVANVMDVSKDFLLKIKRLENGSNLGDDKFINTPYPDVNGYSIGIGHYLGEKPDLNMKISDEEVCTYFAEDLLKAEDSLIGLLGNGTYAEIPQSIKEALLDMVFNKSISIIDSEMVKDLKAKKYDDVICKMTYNKANTVKEGQIAEKSGLSKRRLFDISVAIGYYKKDIPQKIKDTAQQVYDRGVALLEAECAAKKLSFENVLAGYNKDIQAYFGNRIKLTYK